jgi:hypothetical protein
LLLLLLREALRLLFSAAWLCALCASAVSPGRPSAESYLAASTRTLKPSAWLKPASSSKMSP